MHRAALAVSLFLSSATLALAVGSDSSEPPAPTPTSSECSDGQLWDEKSKACISARSSGLTEDDRYRAVRELAYAGRYGAALSVVEAMEPASDRAMTYRGFIARKQGDWPKAMAFYEQALSINPDNILARSYLGQGLALRGETAAAEAQLSEIRLRGGSGSWAEAALIRVIEGDEAYNY